MAVCPKCGDLLSREFECAQCGTVTPPGERSAAAFSYLWIPAVVFLFTASGPKTRFVRFHCVQAFLWGLLMLVITALLWSVAMLLDPYGSVMLVFRTLSFLAELALLLFWVLAALKAYTGEEYTLPVVGGLARKYC